MTEKEKNIILYFFGLFISVVGLWWICLSVVPGGIGKTEPLTNDLVLRLSSNVNNSKAETLGDIAYIEKIYKIPLSATVAPEPDENGFGQIAVENAAEVEKVIEEARQLGLLDGQDMIFSTDREFFGDDIKYYLDDSILVLCWQEKIDGCTCCLSEIKVRDASQFRRKLSNNTFNSGVTDSLIKMGSEANAIVAMNGDYYNFRDYGICIYDNEICRFRESSFSPGTKSYNYIDSLLIDENGDFHFFRQGEETTGGELEKFVDDNGIMFSLSFGPVLVDDYVVQKKYEYPIGEVYKSASRAAIAQVDRLHYLYLNVSASKSGGANFGKLADIVGSFHVKDAYNLDGGQTAEITFKNRVFNYIDYGAERYTSDCIYFATAKPAV